jgi:flagellar P-ring protein precursor FlgI
MAAKDFQHGESVLMRWLLPLFALGTSPASTDRIKDLGAFQGLRANQLTGYGIVVGLAGTGDDSLDYATQGVKSVVSRFGLTLPPGVNPSLKNAAAVLITAELPPFAKPGQRLDITVSALGKAKSLRGGTLILVPLRGADNQIYAMAQGNLAVGGLGVDAADGSKLTVNVPTAVFDWIAAAHASLSRASMVVVSIPNLGNNVSVNQRHDPNAARPATT